MYEAHFGFAKRPFLAAPQPDRYFPAAEIEGARQTLTRSIGRAEGPGLVIGPAGTGKSLLCHLLAEHFRETFSVVMLANSRLCTRRALLQSILFELGLPYRDMEEGELRLTLIDYLEPSDKRPNGMLLLVDEAHTLPLRLLEEVRMITNLVRDGQPRVRLVLAGGPVLEERFASAKLESFNQRIAARCYLNPMNGDETRNYLYAQLAAVGGDAGRVFDQDALRSIYQATDGIPRLVNQLADHALMMAAAAGRGRLDTVGVQEAWADLQQLPGPWESRETAPSEQTAVVEFGGLSDEEPAETCASLAFGPPAANDTDYVNPAAALDVIERGIQEADRDQPPGDAVLDLEIAGGEVAEDTPEPEAELIFHGPHDPFEESFDDEEVIVDRYAALVSSSKSEVDFTDHEAAVASNAVESAEVSESPSHSVQTDVPPADAAVEQVRVEPLSAGGSGSPADELESDSMEQEQTVIDFGGQVYEESDAGEDDTDTVPAVAYVPLRVMASDDRDLIEIQDDDVDEPVADGPAVETKLRRQEYRQLFARLRRG